MKPNMVKVRETCMKIVSKWQFVGCALDEPENHFELAFEIDDKEWEEVIAESEDVLEKVKLAFPLNPIYILDYTITSTTDTTSSVDLKIVLDY